MPFTTTVESITQRRHKTNSIHRVKQNARSSNNKDGRREGARSRRHLYAAWRTTIHSPRPLPQISIYSTFNVHLIALVSVCGFCQDFGTSRSERGICYYNYSWLENIWFSTDVKWHIFEVQYRVCLSVFQYTYRYFLLSYEISWEVEPPWVLGSGYDHGIYIQYRCSIRLLLRVGVRYRNQSAWLPINLYRLHIDKITRYF